MLGEATRPTQYTTRTAADRKKAADVDSSRASLRHVLQSRTESHRRSHTHVPSAQPTGRVGGSYLDCLEKLGLAS